MSFIYECSKKISFSGIEECYTHMIELVEIGHDQLPEFETIASPGSCPVYFSRSERLSLWMKKCNTINNVVNTVSIKDRLQLSNSIRWSFRRDIADFNLTVVHVCTTISPVVPFR